MKLTSQIILLLERPVVSNAKSKTTKTKDIHTEEQHSTIGRAGTSRAAVNTPESPETQVNRNEELVNHVSEATPPIQFQAKTV